MENTRISNDYKLKIKELEQSKIKEENERLEKARKIELENVKNKEEEEKRKELEAFIKIGIK